MQIINGRQIAQDITNNLKSQPAPKKIFAAVLIGNDKISENFLSQKEKVAKKLGVDFRIYRFSADLKNDDLREEVRKIALLKRVGGIIVHLPLPEHFNKHYILNVIPREKDVDVLGERALGAFYTGRNPILPPSVGVVTTIIENCKLKIENLRVAVVGAGFLVGKPITLWLIDKVKELTIFEKGSDLAQLKNYDLIISGVGQAGLIKPEMLKEGAGVIDFGYSPAILRDSQTDADLTQTNAEINKLVGDFDSSQLSNIKSQLLFYTPTPGGTGPILVAKVFENFYKLNKE
jgi:5,10-methylene-tetrahydrofolate dehydrogenase/methenyl tetrahydrofolate cyclohydrolase